MNSRYNKAIVAAIMGVLGILNTFFNLPIPVTEDQLTALLTALTPILVFWVPNKPA